jgi:transcription-repair coupling factor (superfamily II helicase)
MRAELQDRFGQLPAAVDGLLYQINVKLLAQDAGASAVLARPGKIEVKLPYLVEVRREALEVMLSAGKRDIRVTRVAVELQTAPETWRARLLEVLNSLAAHRRLALGV